MLFWDPLRWPFYRMYGVKITTFISDILSALYENLRAIAESALTFVATL